MAKIAVSITPRGIETIAFLDNKDEAQAFYTLIREELQAFESQILNAVSKQEISKIRVGLEREDEKH